MADLATFVYLRPVFIFFIIVLAISLIIVIFQKKKRTFINGFTIMSISLICSVASIIMMYQIGMIADELVLGGDSVSFTLFIAVAVLSLMNPIVYFYKKIRKKTGRNAL